MKIKNENKYVKIGAIITIIVNCFLSLAKIIVGIQANSNALLADGLDSLSDVLIGSITLIIVFIISKPADCNHPWGHRRAETVATAFLSFIIFLMGSQLIINSSISLIKNQSLSIPSLNALITAIISIILKILLAKTQFFLAKKAKSPLLKANAKNMLADSLISLGVLIGLIISKLSNSPLADKIISILIGIYIIITAISIFKEVNLELMDGNTDKNAYKIIVNAVNSVNGASNPHRARMRKIAGFWDISFDIFVDENLTVSEAHDIASKVENEIKSQLDNVFDIMVHVEPNTDTTIETYGLSEKEIN